MLHLCMGKVRCLFCAETRKRAKEHLWPGWLQRELEGGTALRTETHYAIAGQPVNRRTLQNGALVLGRVCETCNTGWMSKLERRAIDVLRPLLSTESLVGRDMTPEKCAVLAVWAFKTAIVRNRGTNYKKLVPDSHFRMLYDTRTVPEDVFVDLAVCPAHRTLGAVQSQTLAGMLTRGDEATFDEQRSRAYNICLGVGPILMRVVHLPLPGYEVTVRLAHGRRAIRLWPRPVGDVIALENFVSELWDFETSTFFDVVLADGAA